MAEVKLDAPAVEAASGPLREVARMFLKNHAAVGALAVLLLIVAAAVIGPPLYSDDPYEMVWAPFSPPGADGFLLGTDYWAGISWPAYFTAPACPWRLACRRP